MNYRRALGLGLLGVSLHAPLLAILGFAGALLHVVNHALFKGVLFLGAGSVYHATGTRNMERLGGMLKRMPVTGATFLVGAVAISGLPPLNGFVSEFMILAGAFNGILLPGGRGMLVFLGVIVALALIGGLAATCFARAFGIVFLGEPRSGEAASGHEAGPAMTVPMVILAVGCVAIGILSPIAAAAAMPVAATLAGVEPAIAARHAGGVTDGFMCAAGVTAVLLALTAALIRLRARLLRGRAVHAAVTWDCGYAAPTSRMQYTASSFAQPLTSFFRHLLRQRQHGQSPHGLFPRDTAFETHAPDVMREAVYTPVFGWIRRTLGELRRLQEGRLQLYVLYLVLTLVVLILWQLWRGL